MTASVRGTAGAPGRRVRQKASLNRAVLDAAPGEFRRQLTYKSIWYGSKIAVLDRWFPSSKTCSACGWQNSRLTLADRKFHCLDCGIDRPGPQRRPEHRPPRRAGGCSTRHPW
ncbi:zinc ribbon domain-containing protein [Streptomyces sp. SS]|uniref:zinc ribbon domain-containing protein n=1 Tax=Streptomyces sp. SS TaxID=260742 RepID=UPI000FFC1630|nr:zinc ribbon domain-containing protein [Streptomyces sp. SS]